MSLTLILLADSMSPPSSVSYSLSHPYMIKPTADELGQSAYRIHKVDLMRVAKSIVVFGLVLSS